MLNARCEHIRHGCMRRRSPSGTGRLASEALFSRHIGDEFLPQGPFRPSVGPDRPIPAILGHATLVGQHNHVGCRVSEFSPGWRETLNAKERGQAARGRQTEARWDLGRGLGGGDTTGSGDPTRLYGAVGRLGRDRRGGPRTWAQVSAGLCADGGLPLAAGDGVLGVDVHARGPRRSGLGRGGESPGGRKADGRTEGRGDCNVRGRP
jgi:hypothetical protein